MARMLFEALSDQEPTLVYIAGNVTEAETAEQVLQQNGVDYALVLDAFVKSSLLGGKYTGLFVYVPKVDSADCRMWLESQGLTDTIDLGAVD